MRIQTLNRSYEILQRLQDNERIEILIARDEKQREIGKCLLLILKQEEDIHRWIPFCAQQKDNLPFDDFLGYFPRDGFLYVVFRYYEYDTLEKRLEGGPPLKERLLAVRSLFQRMVFLHLPKYLQYEALQDQNLLVDESHTVYFNFVLQEPDQFESVVQEDIWNRIGKILKRVFAEELDCHSCPSLEAFLEQLSGYEFDSDLTLFKRYDLVCQELIALQEKNEVRPQSFGFRLWGRIKKLFKYVKYVLFAVVIVGLLWYLVYTIQNPEYQGGEAIDYQAIGTLKLEDPGESEE